MAGKSQKGVAEVAALCFGGSPGSEKRVEHVAACFGIGMMLLALSLPFFYAKGELSVWPTLLQLALGLGFSWAWLFQGYLLEKSGFGIGYTRNDSPGKRSMASPREIAFFLLVFGPLCFVYIYVAFLNTGYFGFSYVLMFVLAGFSSLLFPFWLASLYLVYQCFAWTLLAHLMWGGWMQFDDLITTLSGFFFSAMMFYLFRRERESRSRAIELTLELDEANEKLRQFSGKVEELAATQERNRIAREIHDTIGHSLTVVNMQLETAKALVDADSARAKEFLEKAQSVTKRGLEEIRSSVASLRASPLEGKPLHRALQQLLESAFSSSVATEFRVEGDIRELPTAVETALYRSAQEALTNARKHARAKRVTMEIDYGSDHDVMLIVKDDGVGCETAEGGFGMLGIRERIQLLDGAMRVSTSPGAGLELRLSVPL